MGTRFRIVFKDDASHLTAGPPIAAKTSRGTSKSPATGDRPTTQSAVPFISNNILLDPSLLNLLSTDDRIRFIAAQTVYNNVIHGRGYFGDREEAT